MELYISETPDQLGSKAALKAAGLLREAVRSKGAARFLVSTGASQFETFFHLLKEDVHWSRVELFHLDEYVGIPETHGASFVKYLKERFINLLPVSLKAAHLINGMGDPAQEIAKASAEIRKAPIDAALIGIGENAHIAFNDPPADFDTKEAFITVTLDEACKAQQVRENWFPTISDVPKTAITMSVSQIMDSAVILSAVPHIQKAEAIRKTFAYDLTSQVPSTMLKTHKNWTLYLDKASASTLPENVLKTSRG